jgi:hypothetical protein
MRRGIDDAGGRVGVEKERLRFRLLVGEKFDVVPANFRDGVVPLSTLVENRGQRAIDVLCRPAAAGSTAYCSDKRLCAV